MAWSGIFPTPYRDPYIRMRPPRSPLSTGFFSKVVVCNPVFFMPFFPCVDGASERLLAPCRCDPSLRFFFLSVRRLREMIGLVLYFFPSMFDPGLRTLARPRHAPFFPYTSQAAFFRLRPSDELTTWTLQLFFLNTPCRSFMRSRV